MRCDVVTLMPDLVTSVASCGVTGRAVDRRLADVVTWNPRDFCTDPYRTVDDRPYGGGPGMVMMPEPISQTLDAIAAAQHAATGEVAPVVLLAPTGERFSQDVAASWARLPALTLLCGRYEGIDQRLLDARVQHVISLGDFVISGGELGAMVVIDACFRLLPGALNDVRSAQEESFVTGLLDHPHFTRPEVWQGVPVPPVLLSGHHAQIERWRRDTALQLTRRQRPDLIERARAMGRLTAKDEQVLQQLPRHDG